LHKLATDLGAHWGEVQADDPAHALIEYARKHQITQIVLGSSRRSRWEELTKGSVVRRILREAADADTDVHVIARRDVSSEAAEPDAHAEES
jgi:two-component system sensor histidine kinase KdpD